MRVVLATKNKHKLLEFKNIFKESLEILSLLDIGFNEEIEETGTTFIENSLIKCKKIYESVKMPVLADDSGLCVESLNYEPGVLSARFGGKNLTDKERYELLLTKLDRNRKHNASFVCALSLYINPNRIYVIQEEVKGEITFEPKGTNGFGYDPIFYLPELNKTMAELSAEEKNRISHRAKASYILNKILQFGI
ncbi:MAG TPA: RdgB/HAM1 family non-canonical purine NTP pyrophosphatase [Spirochaetota bacterium]|nr:RdgB/HAM1 family non-canonical purine NTP pyrophosphatase [Spirochaetota bacterium]HPP04676.1 RdgB/HAM1 family non-canonical purine NTP pyrophosphatase [Spirochaetota bacterium]